jgi:hypothetical protein
VYLENPDARDVVVRNNIFSRNLTYQIAHGMNPTEQNITIDHNLIDGYRGEIEEETHGSDPVEGNPRFVNPSGADFHLQEDSPAIDSGSSIDAPRDDFDGTPRPRGVGYDIGAFEFGEVGIDEPSNGIPATFNLFQNYPNPFNTTTQIEYSMAGSGDIELRILNSSGQRVRMLINRSQGAGRHVVEWDGTADDGKQISSGIYFYHLKANRNMKIRKCVFLK